MRKITERTNEEKKTRRNQFLVGGLLILVMVLSVLGYSLGRNNQEEEAEKVIYNGYEFTKTNDFWTTTIGSFQFSFKYNPYETEKISSQINYLNTYSNKPLYLSGGNMEAETEIYRNLFYQTGIAQRVQYACLQGEKCEDGSFPIKNCTDNFVIIRENNQSDILSQNKSEIKQQDGCVFITGISENLTSTVDSFLFKIMGISE
ncbi:MAG: hypothetical protein NTU63_02135 [Candidatus Pacearchaeota archaeon]|nr:hypothetical protein [Candidatus Pacearchaeota archaeon]